MCYFLLSQFRLFTDWCDGFMLPVITESIRVLRPGGVLVLNVGDYTRAGMTREICAVALRLVV
jgi:hypothetical protein